MPLTILLVAYPFAAIGDDAVGGAEQVMTILQRGLARVGYRTLVVAAKEREGLRLDEDGLAQGRRRHAEAVRDALALVPVDLVHMHGVDFEHYLPRTNVPVIVTLHLPPQFYRDSLLHASPSAAYFNCVSDSQKRALGLRGVDTPVIPNGIDIERFERRYPKRGFTLSLGRVCPEKGFQFAMEAAKKADVDWLVGGRIFLYESHCRYFPRSFNLAWIAAGASLGQWDFWRSSACSLKRRVYWCQALWPRQARWLVWRRWRPALP